jgi:hypothetical protein
MKREKLLTIIFVCLLCVLWADIITPRMHSGPHDDIEITPGIFAFWLAGWVVIAGIFMVVNWLSKKKIK